MDFRISRHGDLEVGDTLQPRHEIRCIRKSIRMRRIPTVSLWRIAAERNEMPDSLIPVFPRDIQNLAGQALGVGDLRHLAVGRIVVGADPAMFSQRKPSRGSAKMRH